MSKASDFVGGDMLTWPLPSGLAANDELTREARANYYLATTRTLLGDGTSVLPNSETLNAILDAWDYFGVEVVICSDSYVVR